VRHGETDWNVEGRYQGRQDPPLNERGWAQARALADYVRAHPVAAVVASPLQRAEQTASVCAAALGLQCSTDDALVEIAHGSWEGKLRADVARDDAERYRAWEERPHTVTFPGGENLADVERRLAAFLTHASAHGDSLLAVTHDLMVRMAVLAAQGLPASALSSTIVENAAVNEFELEDGRLHLVRLNHTEHLEGLRSDLTRQAR